MKNKSKAVLFGCACLYRMGYTDIRSVSRMEMSEPGVNYFYAGCTGMARDWWTLSIVLLI